MESRDPSVHMESVLYNIAVFFEGRPLQNEIMLGPAQAPSVRSSNSEH